MSIASVGNSYLKSPGFNGARSQAKLNRLAYGRIINKNEKELMRYLTNSVNDHLKSKLQKQINFSPDHHNSVVYGSINDNNHIIMPKLSSNHKRENSVSEMLGRQQSEARLMQRGNDFDLNKKNSQSTALLSPMSGKVFAPNRYKQS